MSSKTGYLLLKARCQLTYNLLNYEMSKKVDILQYFNLVYIYWQYNSIISNLNKYWENEDK